MMALMKCYRCKEDKPATTEAFQSDPRNALRSGFSSWCRSCHNARKTELRALRSRDFDIPPRTRPVIDGKIACKKCKERKPTEDFYRDPGGKYFAYCRPCDRQRGMEWNAANKGRKYARHILRTYKITVEVYEELRESQKNLCGICEELLPERRGFAVDHDHESGAVRGVLCMKCNTGLGCFNDSAEKLAKAIQYLTRVR